MSKLIQQWASIPGYEGIYSAGSLGHIRSDRAATNSMPGLVRKPYVHKKTGYCVMNLSRHGIAVTHHVHRLIATAFIPNPNNLREVNHKDGNRQNNALDNLEWVSSKENKAHAISIGLGPITGVRHHMAKLTPELAKIIRLSFTGRVGEPKEIAKKYGVSTTTIVSVLKNKTWKTA